MQQVPIEEVLVKFREKYANVEATEVENGTDVPENSENLGNSENSDVRDVSETLVFSSSRAVRHGRRYSFKRLIAVQAGLAVVIVTLIIAARFLKPELYEYIIGFIRARV